MEKGITMTNGKSNYNGLEKEMNREELYNWIQEFLVYIIAGKIGQSPDELSPATNFDELGLESSMVAEFNTELEKMLPNVSKIILFENRNIKELAQYLVKNHGQELTEIMDKGGMGLELAEEREPAPAVSEKSGERDALSGSSNRALPEEERLDRVVLQKPSLEETDGWEEMKPIRERRKSSAANTAAKRNTRAEIPSSTGDIAIIGVSGRYPLANSLEEFWENLVQGKDCITEIPAERWDWRKEYDPKKGKANKVFSKWGGFIEDVDKFDAMFFGMTPMDAEGTDPQERIFLEVAHQALEDAGHTRTSLKDKKVGVFVGAMYNHYSVIGAEESIRGNYMALNSLHGSIANRVSYYFNFNGPSIALDTMCSSALTALYLACTSIKAGDSDMAVVGGVNLTLHPDKYRFLCGGKLASSEGKCRAFGEGGDGYVPGEGVGAIVIKPLEKAMTDGDPVYAVIKGIAVNHGGRTNGYTVPDPNAQAALISSALAKSGVDPRTISYVEAHGTGTPLGDPIEITGLTKAYREYTKDSQFCPIGSVKANVGHLESAAGIVAVTKVLLQMKYRKLVPSILSNITNPNINFADSPFYIQQNVSPWKKPVIEENGIKKEYPRRVGISSFGAGGSNSHLILEELERPQDIYGDGAARQQIIVLSARNEERLKVYAGKMAEFLEKAMKDGSAGNIGLANLAYTLQAGREAMEERLAMVVSSLEQAKDGLKAFCLGNKKIKDFYRGKAGKSESTLWFDGEEGEVYIKAIMDGKKLGKIAQLWVTGIQVDWGILHAEKKPVKVSLPTYPFEKRRCWPTEVNGTLVGDITAFWEKGLHPLIDTNISTQEEQCYSKSVDENTPFSNEYLLNGTPALPPSLCMEMAWAAAALSTKRSRVMKLYEFEMPERYTVSSLPESLCISLFPEGEGVGFELRPLKEEEAAFCFGKIQLGEGTPSEIKPQALDIGELAGRCGMKPVKDEFYGRFSKANITYGSSLQVIEEYGSIGSETLAYMKIKDTDHGLAGKYALHPAILEGAFQVAATAAAESPEYKLSAVGEIVSYGKFPDNCYIYAYCKDNTDGNPEEIIFDIDVSNDAGEVFLKLENVILSR